MITTYGTVMRTAWMRAHAWRNVILDEAQAIKNPSAKQTRTVKALDSKWRLALTGTPVENRLGDLWSIFDFSESRLLGVGQGVHPVLQVPGIGHARRLHAAAQASAAVSLAKAQDRQACHRRSARQN